MHKADIIVIGAGIAGSSAAAVLAADADVLLLEMEPQPGYHATGRSAAYMATSYGKPAIQALTASCGNFFSRPPDGFTEVELLRPRDCVIFGRADQTESLRAEHERNPHLEIFDPDELCMRVPILSRAYVHGALRDPRGGDLDVDALLQAYLKLFRRSGGRLLCNQRVSGLTFSAGCWHVSTGSDLFSAPIVVNAAGGWVEKISQLAGLAPLGIQPMRRTALTIAAPEGMLIDDWPELFDVDETFYFKPDAGQILISPADETPCEPCDAQAEELDVAMGVYRFEQATGLDISRVNHSWAGLRTFAPDEQIVAGFDPRCEGFFWLAGQGGFGVMTSPAMAQLSRYLVQGIEPDTDFTPTKALVSEFAPERLIS